VGQLGSGPRLVGRIGSGVRVSVSFRQKYPPGSVLRRPTAAENVVMTKGVVSGGGFDLRLQRITSSPSQTIRPRLVRRTATDAAVSARLDACRRSRLYFSHFATYGLQYWTCMQCMQRYSFRIAFFLPHHLHSTPLLQGFRSEYRHPVWHGKIRMAWIPDMVEKFSRYLYSF